MDTKAISSAVVRPKLYLGDMTVNYLLVVYSLVSTVVFSVISVSGLAWECKVTAILVSTVGLFWFLARTNVGIKFVRWLIDSIKKVD